MLIFIPILSIWHLEPASKLVPNTNNKDFKTDIQCPKTYGSGEKVLKSEKTFRKNCTE